MFIQMCYIELKDQGIITGKEETDEAQEKIKVFFSKLWDVPELMFHRIWVVRDMSNKISRIEFSVPFSFFKKNKDW